MSDEEGAPGPVVAAIDLTDGADEVLRQAFALSQSLQCRLVVCHVLHEILQARVLFPQLAHEDATKEAEVERHVRDALDARIAVVAGEGARTVEVVVETGTAHAGVLSRAEQLGAALIVVGPGAVAEHVARYAPCAVLVARPSPRGAVLGATDFSDPSLPAIETAVAEAQRRGAILRLMHCQELSEPLLLGSPRVALGVLPAVPHELIEALERDGRARLQAALERFGVKGECLVTRGVAALSIVETARAVDTELVVIGMRGRSNLSRLLLGSVADAVLRTAPCSVMVVHLTR